MTLEAAFYRFLYLKQLQGCSDKTVSCYQQVLLPFIKFVGDIPLTDLSRENHNEYIYLLTQRKYSRATFASYVRQLKVFIRWLESEYHLSLESEKLKVPVAHRRVVHIFSDGEIIDLFDSIEASPEWIRLRNCAMVALMLDSGLRQNEVACLRSEDIYWSSGTLKVLGKGAKERVVPFGCFSRDFMKMYREQCPYSDEYFFVDRHGGVLTADAVKHFMHKLSDKLPFDVSSHRLRHNFATNYCLNQYEKYGTIDLYRLMILMGHEDIETTRIYLHHANQIIASVSAISHLDKILRNK